MNTEIIKFYEKGNSRRKTCDFFKISDKELINILKAHAIPIRARKEQLIIENKRRTKNIDHTYFDIPTNENMYYVGFLAADGTVRKDRNEIKVALAEKDLNFLTQMKEKIKIEKEIKIRETTNGFTCAELSFSSENIKKVLMSYGVVPNKTYIGLSLNKIPKDFRLAFIKGFFDGDGSFSFNENTKQGSVKIVSHKKEILEDIKNYFNAGNIYRDKRTTVYSLEFSTISSIKILSSFYQLQTPFLQRKYNKFLNFMSLRNNNPRDRIS